MVAPLPPKVVLCSVPYRAEVGKPFTIDVSLSNPGVVPQHPNPARITMIAGEYFTYQPKTFTLLPLDHKLVQATSKGGLSGLALVEAFSDGEYNSCGQVVDVGFTGHLKVITQQLPYKEPRALSIEIVDNNEKPLRTGVNLTMLLQSEDASINRSDDATHDAHIPLSFRVIAGSTSSVPFRITSESYKGGPVHLLATLSIPDGGTVLAQSTFVFEADPATWLPIALAIGGALLYAGYHLLQETNLDHMVSKILWRGATAIFAGGIAYLFADFDLLGLKLDPHVLRTYAILGFLFSFVGIDVLLAKRFKPDGNAQ